MGRRSQLRSRLKSDKVQKKSPGGETGLFKAASEGARRWPALADLTRDRPKRSRWATAIMNDPVAVALGRLGRQRTLRPLHCVGLDGVNPVAL